MRQGILAKILAVSLALAALACAFGEGLEIDSALVENGPGEVVLELSENGATANDSAGYTPVSETWVISAAASKLENAFNVGDTLRLRVNGATLTGCAAAKQGIVEIGALQEDAEGPYVDIRALAAYKKLKLNVTVSGGKKKKLSATLSISDPNVPTAVEFNALMPSSITAGETLDLSDKVRVVPEGATKDLLWKATGAAKADKNGLLTTSRTGKAVVTATVASNKKVKASFTLQVLPNRAADLSEKPAAADCGGIAGGWTLWPLSAEVSRKNLVCQLYVLNATGEKSRRIDGLELQVAVGRWRNVVARKSFKKVTCAAASGGSKLIKLTLPITGSMEGASLAEHAAAGTLYFRVNADAVTLKTRSRSWPYIATRLPAEGGALVERIELSAAEVGLRPGDALTLSAATLPANAENAALLWSSSDPAVVTAEGGVLTALGIGEATVTAEAADGGGARATCRVYVSATSGFVIENGVVTGYRGTGGALTVPEADADGAPVVAVGEAAFAGNAAITAITLPATTRSVGARAFDGCAALTRVALPDAVSSIGTAAFRDCPALEEVETY